MILNDASITRMLENGTIVGAELNQVNPASLNVRLGYSFLRPLKPDVIVLGEDVLYETEYLYGSQTTCIMPGEFLLATTCESFKLPPCIAAFVQGRSSIGRIGLMVQNAGFVDPGFQGNITLELKNDSPNPIRLVPGYPVAQLVFFETMPVMEPYHGKYNGQKEATGSRMWMDKTDGTVKGDKQ